ncbi:MAG: hypothetical protein NTV09_04280 [Bacteroidetes bacterium]|nr:hypothetical protein [Bacteroidota bacterium]
MEGNTSPQTKPNDQLNILKAEYIWLMNERDVLLNWGKPQLEALYNIRIGVHKIKLLELELQIRALKRKLELVRSAINTNSKIDFVEIELTIAAELAKAQEQIMIAAEKIIEDRGLLDRLDTPARSAELRTIFRTLAKNLHPDVNPELSPEQKNIWNLVLEAYHLGDLEKLKALALVYEKEIKGTETELTDEQIALAIESIKEGCKNIQKEITGIRNSFPFTIEKEINDDAWIAEETEEVNTIILFLTRFEKELTDEYKALIETHE